MSMKYRQVTRLVFAALFLCTACKTRKMNADSYEGSVKTSNYENKPLPTPFATGSSQNFSEVTGWKDNEHPLAPEGFTVTRFAEGLSHPRWIYVCENGDVFVAESNTILKG